MDEIDKQILMLLQQNAKQNTKEIAEKIGLSVSPTYERIKKLEQNNVIDKYVVLLNGAKIEKSIIIFCQVSLVKHSKDLIDNFKKRITVLSEVMGCQHVSGNYDFLLKVVVKDMNEYKFFVTDKLSIIEGISNVQSSFVIEEIKNNTAYTII